jgi:hypothetical protein
LITTVDVDLDAAAAAGQPGTWVPLQTRNMGYVGAPFAHWRTSGGVEDVMVQGTPRSSTTVGFKFRFMFRSRSLASRVVRVILLAMPRIRGST